jgi:hypothetical protein
MNSTTVTSVKRKNMEIKWQIARSATRCLDFTSCPALTPGFHRSLSDFRPIETLESSKDARERIPNKNPYHQIDDRKVEVVRFNRTAEDDDEHVPAKSKRSRHKDRQRRESPSSFRLQRTLGYNTYNSLYNLFVHWKF